MLRMDNSELVNRSDLVIYGVVKGLRSKGKSQEAVVSVKYVLKGKPPTKSEASVIFSPGLEDSPIFELNELVLLFLREISPGLFQTTGGVQGKFPFGKQTIQ